MPSKPKLYKNHGKKHISNKPQENSTIDATASTSSLTPVLEQQFEVELCWCIQQLQIAIQSGKLNNKQVQDHTKTLNTLMSNTAPMVKKRQLMRISFGDYRSKMATEEEKLSRRILNIRVKPSTPSKKSVFIKRSTFTSSGSSFSFNFESPKDDVEEYKDSAPSNDCCRPDMNNEAECQYVPSDNSFRFGLIPKKP